MTEVDLGHPASADELADLVATAEQLRDAVTTRPRIRVSLPSHRRLPNVAGAAVALPSETGSVIGVPTSTFPVGLTSTTVPAASLPAWVTCLIWLSFQPAPSRIALRLVERTYRRSRPC